MVRIENNWGIMIPSRRNKGAWANFSICHNYQLAWEQVWLITRLHHLFSAHIAGHIVKGKTITLRTRKVFYMGKFVVLAYMPCFHALETYHFGCLNARHRVYFSKPISLSNVKYPLSLLADICGMILIKYLGYLRSVCKTLLRCNTESSVVLLLLNIFIHIPLIRFK